MIGGAEIDARVIEVDARLIALQAAMIQSQDAVIAQQRVLIDALEKALAGKRKGISVAASLAERFERPTRQRRVKVIH